MAKATPPKRRNGLKKKAAAASKKAKKSQTHVKVTGRPARASNNGSARTLNKVENDATLLKRRKSAAKQAASKKSNKSQAYVNVQSARTNSLSRRTRRHKVENDLAPSTRRSNAAAVPSKASKTKSQTHVKLKFQPAWTSSSSSPRTVENTNKGENDVLEWVGDAVLDELVGRSLLRHVHNIFSAPTTIHTVDTQASDVSNLALFRQLRNALVTNATLSAVYDKLFPTILVIHPSSSVKQKADAVETLVGRISTRHKSAKDIHQLDTILSMMLQVEFTHWAVEQEETARQSINQFSLLEPWLDTDDDEDALGLVPDQSNHATSSLGDRLLPASSPISPSSRVPYPPPKIAFHAFADPMISPRTDDTLSLVVDVVRAWVPALQTSSHILQSSRVMFEVFKLYGLSVLKERISTFLVQSTKPISTPSRSPATLTWVRQQILSIHRLAQTASVLSIVSTDHPTKLQANTLRAAVGFASAMNRPDIVDAICCLLMYLHQSPEMCLACGTAAPTDLDDLALHEGSTCPYSLAAFIATQWHAHLPSVTSLADLPRTAAATVEFLKRRHIPWETQEDTLHTWLPSRWCDLDLLAAPTLDSTPSRKRKRVHDGERRSPGKKKNTRRLASSIMSGHVTLIEVTHEFDVVDDGGFLQSDWLNRFLPIHSCYDTAACRLHLREAADDLEPCIDDLGVCSVSDQCLSLVLKDSFYRLLMHELVNFHHLDAKSHTKPNGLRVMQIRRPKGYVWPEDAYTNEAVAIVD
ncbi:hypothetical protein DYB37_001425 [Aphanomyces astaci]|uniref:RNase III domain-containing protein n=1 Tax=Aphanomyces astaci TaxID=112090 RepID=A0A3R7BHM8_APHAT|nr:hypothetical protein DYB35_009699 [Aphanomyces astaci]RHZ20671.1 hypothetical protein DYB37_001425 [Aphanomyces astaci]